MSGSCVEYGKAEVFEATGDVADVRKVFVRWYIGLLIAGLGFGPFVALVIEPAAGGEVFGTLLAIGGICLVFPACALLLGSTMGRPGLWRVEVPANIAPASENEKAYVRQMSIRRYPRLIGLGLWFVFVYALFQACVGG